MYYHPTLPWEEPLPDRVAKSVDRISSTPTIASLAARHRFDAQVCHLRFLQYYDDKVVPSRHDENRDADQAIRRMKTPIRRVRPKSSGNSGNSRDTAESRPQTASTRPSTAATRPGHDFEKRICVMHMGYKSVEAEPELEEIMQRVSRPTTASMGARNLAGKKYDYYNPPETKTYKILPGIETRFMGRKKMSQEEYDAVLARLGQHTKSSHWKIRSVPDPNAHPPRRKPGDFTLANDDRH